MEKEISTRVGKMERKDDELLVNLKNKLPELEKLLEEICSHWKYEDMLYRFYHQSFKVYYVQHDTEKIVAALQQLMPDTKLNEQFMKIVSDGIGKTFSYEHNADWMKHTRPMLEAFLHAKYFLEMCVKYGKELEIAPNMLPSGWAAFLYLFNMR